MIPKLAGKVPVPDDPPRRTTVVSIRTVTSWPVFLLWIGLTFAVALLSTWCYFHSAWTIRSSSQVQNKPSLLEQRIVKRSLVFESQPDDDDTVTDLYRPVTRTRITVPLLYIGLFDICIYPTKSIDETSICVAHEDLEYHWLPQPWQVTRVLCGGSCFLFIITVITSVAAVLIRESQLRHHVVKYIGILQFCSALLMLIGLCFYPLGLYWENIGHLCNGHCHSGWSSLVTGLCSVAAFLCPVLASLVANPVYDVKPWESSIL